MGPMSGIPRPSCLPSPSTGCESEEGHIFCSECSIWDSGSWNENEMQTPLGNRQAVTGLRNKQVQAPRGGPLPAVSCTGTQGPFHHVIPHGTDLEKCPYQAACQKRLPSLSLRGAGVPWQRPQESICTAPLNSRRWAKQLCGGSGSLGSIMPHLFLAL